jgi:signal transduction histidine kinase
MIKSRFPDARIWMLDDNLSTLRLLEMILQAEGYKNIRTFSDAHQFLAAFRSDEADLIVLDLVMPEMSGFDVMERLRQMIPSSAFLPILVLTADASSSTKQQALEMLATDFLTKPFDRVEVRLRIGNLLWTRYLHLEQLRYEKELELTVKERTIELRTTLNDLKKAQQHISQQERMRALGIMAGGVAHDLNNALSVILGFGELLLRSHEEKGENKREARALRGIITAAQDAASMVSRLGEFSRPVADEHYGPVAINTLIPQALALTGPRWKTQAKAKGISISVKTEQEEIPQVLGNADELREVLTSLIFNAVDAMPKGGVITIATRAFRDVVELSVGDTGAGMTDEVRELCLEPYFTTKGEKGSGVGLAMVNAIVERHGGTLEIRSNPGAGATFTFRFPALKEASRSPEASPAPAVEAQHIMVVDHNETFRDILTQLLEQDGHAVTTADWSGEAFELLHRERFDLVIISQTMPGMTVREFVERLKEVFPRPRLVILTGFSAGEDPEDAFGADLILRKPITLENLRKGIADVARSELPHINGA